MALVSLGAALGCETSPLALPGFEPGGPVLIPEAGAVAPLVVGDFKLVRAMRPFDLPCCARLLYDEQTDAAYGATLSIAIRPRQDPPLPLTKELAAVHRRITKQEKPLDLPNATRW